jgi:hypothetical protein
MELLSNLTSSKQYCESIISSAYEQRASTYPRKKVYHAIGDLFMDRFDPTCSILDEKDKRVYMNQRLIEIATAIDETPDTHYDAFHYSKQMKQSHIQTGLQQPNQLSSLLYLSDLYKVTSVLYLDALQCKVTTSVKTRTNLHILYKDGSFMELDEPLDVSEGVFDNLGECFVLDTKDVHIYVPHLLPISKYKSPELIDMAKTLGLSLDIQGKKKVKKQLYDEINVYHLQHSP